MHEMDEKPIREDWPMIYLHGACSLSLGPPPPPPDSPYQSHGFFLLFLSTDLITGFRPPYSAEVTNREAFFPLWEFLGSADRHPIADFLVAREKKSLGRVGPTLFSFGFLTPPARHAGGVFNSLFDCLDYRGFTLI